MDPPASQDAKASQAAPVVEETDPEIMPPDDGKDRKWHGVPPAGSVPLPGKGRYIAEMLVVIAIEFIIWGIYRYFSAPYIEPFGSIKFSFAHMIAAPTIHLGPILIYWKLYRKEPGFIVNFTRKRLLSGMLIGLVGAVVWRTMEMSVYHVLGSITGIYTFSSLDFYTVLEGVTIATFALNTFVQFFVVGPVEEMEFRGFAYDQSARVLTNGQAMALSSVLFGLSHIPIALFLYKMSFLELIVAEVGWMSAGFTFAALYMWSRNILATIIMHGLGNWQLSVYFLSGSYAKWEVSSMLDLVVGSLTSVIINAAMVAIFYGIYRAWWLPHMKGEPAFGGALASVQEFFAAHDYKMAPLANTAGIIAVTTILLCSAIFGLSYTAGERDMMKLYPDFPMPGDDDGMTDIDKMTDLIGNVTIVPGEFITEGPGMDFSLNLNYSMKYAFELEFQLEWTDEPDTSLGILRQATNQPDSFELMVTTPTGESVSASGVNAHGSPGSIVVNVDLLNGTGSSGLESMPAMGNWTITITCTDAGDQRYPFAPLVLTDEGNVVTLTAIVKYKG